MRDELLRRTCEAIVDRLGLPLPFTARAFCETVAASRGRPVQLHPYPFPDGVTSGLCVSTERADHIFYEAHTSFLHQEHIILHELGHVVLGHVEVPAAEEEGLPLPMTNLDTTRVLSILSRAARPGEDERAAELFAELVLQLAQRSRRQTGEPEPDEVLNRMRDALGA